jgi:hypothetical protein
MFLAFFFAAIVSDQFWVVGVPFFDFCVVGLMAWDFFCF